MKPTEKQVSYLLHLLETKGYGNRFMSAKFKALGASMRERSGGVVDWIRSKTKAEVTTIITKLESE